MERYQNVTGDYFWGSAFFAFYAHVLNFANFTKHIFYNQEGEKLFFSTVK